MGSRGAPNNQLQARMIRRARVPLLPGQREPGDYGV
jgi:hypothetical protein